MPDPAHTIRPGRRVGTHLLRAGFTAILLGIVVLLGQVPFGRADDRAVLRLALRTVQAKSEICRDRTAEELAPLPQHMRQPRVCDEITPSYRLSVSLDGERILERAVEPGGLRGDRPLIVDESLELQPGSAELEVALTPSLADLRKALEEGAEIPELPSFHLRERVTLRPARITLVLIDDARGELRIAGDPAARED